MDYAIMVPRHPEERESQMARWRLRDIAEPERWNARKLAKATGLAYNTVWGIWTNTARRADLDTLQALADVLDIQPNDLIGPGIQTPRHRTSEEETE